MLSASVALAVLTLVNATQLPPCRDPTNADYDFVVVGAGAGGGPLAARLAESGFSGEYHLHLSIAYLRVLQSLWWRQERTSSMSTVRFQRI